MLVIGRVHIKTLFLVICFLLMPVSLSAYEKAEELLWACNADEEQSSTASLEKIHCYGYISGILDGVQLVFGVRPESKFFCPPTHGISSDQQVRIVTKWLEDNPKELHTSARVSVVIALSKAFPCDVQ
ncbi:MAG: hypothetical protein ACI9ES_001536 [Oceanospirillaceae bacterium]